MEQLIYERLKENLARLKLGRIAEIFDLIIATAEEIQGKEEKALARMANGECLLDMLNFAEHYRSREAGLDSVLRFKST